MKWKDVFLNPYWRMRKDFAAILNNYQFIYYGKSTHNLRPCIIFRRNKETISICFDYEKGQFFVHIYQDDKDWFGKSILPDNWQDGLKGDYDDQLPIVKGYINNYFN